MRTNFLNGEDKQLISLAYEWEGAGKRISWKDLASRMRRKRRPGELEQRLRALKRTYGKDIARFPRCLRPKSAIQDTQPVKPSTCTPLLASQAEMAVHDIYRSVSAADIRQEAGKTDENAGEMLPTAVTSILQMIGEVQQEDVFLDVGAGLGHVVAQVALQTNAHRCLGIEKRHDVVSAGARCVRSHVSLFGHLRKALVLAGDVLDTPLSTRAPFKAATLIFLNDFLFTEEAKLVVQEELSENHAKIYFVEDGSELELRMAIVAGSLGKFLFTYMHLVMLNRAHKPLLLRCCDLDRHVKLIVPLRRFIGLPRLRILVCGGDVPLGTDNNLVRVLGWGAGLSAPTNVSEILSEVEAAHVSLLDRWQVNIGESKRVVLNNYLGI
ncbi:hypothetical protein DVH05_026044 [Phytophthora capsici]|nr:hypothetical protein DVH05_026044 [Phytophthora capsici]